MCDDTKSKSETKEPASDIDELLDELNKLNQENRKLKYQLKKSKKTNGQIPDNRNYELLKEKYDKIKQENSDLLVMLSEFQYDSKLDAQVK